MPYYIKCKLKYMKNRYKINRDKYQYPKAVIMASDSLPRNTPGTVFRGTGKSPFANSTMATLFYLSAHT